MLSLKVSWKFLIKNKLQNILIFLTIFVGIAAHFFVLSLSGILKNIIVEQSTLYLDHISIRLKRHSFYQNIDLEILNELEQIENVKYATYYVHLIGHVTKRNGERLPFYMRAISDYGYKGTYQEIYGVGLEENLVRGTINNPNKYEIMINDAFALENNINIGDEISFYNNYTNITVKLTVTGTYDTGQIGFLYNDGFLSESLFPFNNLTTNHINITVHDFSKTNETVAEIERLFGNDIQNVSSIYSQFETVNSLNVTQRLIVLVIEILMSITVFVIVSNLLSYII